MTFTNVLSIVLVALSELSLGEDCPSGWTGFGNKCYMYSTEKLSWMEALKKCKNEPATLACLTDSSINNYLWRNDSKVNWIGLQTTGDLSKWYWNTGMPYSSSSVFQWVDGEPNSGEVCARLRPDNKIAGKECDHSGFYFICQSESDQGSWFQGSARLWYYFSTEPENYASKYCSERGSYLAREDVANALDSRLREDREYWLGLSRWYWTDGSQYTWHNFISYERDLDRLGKCYVLHGTENKWEPRSCTETNRYICQKDRGTTTATTSATTSPTTSEQTATSTTTTTNPAIITPATKTSITTKVKSIDTSSSTIASVTDNDSVSDFGKQTTSSDQSTVVLSISKAKRLSGGDSGVLAGAVIGSIAIITLCIVLIVIAIRRSGNDCQGCQSKVTEPQTSYENVDECLPYVNASANTKDIVRCNDTHVSAYVNVECQSAGKGDIVLDKNITTNKQTVYEGANNISEGINNLDNVSYDNIANPDALRNNDYEVISNPYEKMQTSQTGNEPVIGHYQSLDMSLRPDVGLYISDISK